jgi:hypothetical protein
MLRIDTLLLRQRHVLLAIVAMCAIDYLHVIVLMIRACCIDQHLVTQVDITKIKSWLWCSYCIATATTTAASSSAQHRAAQPLQNTKNMIFHQLQLRCTVKFTKIESKQCTKAQRRSSQRLWNLHHV